MQDFLFYLFSALTLIPAVLVVISRNPVNGAMFMIVSLASMAGLFAMLNAFFLAILQVLVYAGAVMVLFLFIIMLLDIETSSKRSPSNLTIAASILGALLLGIGILSMVTNPAVLPSPELGVPVDMPGGAEPLVFATGLDAYGYSLFTKYMLPFQLVGLLLLVAMIGVIVLSKRFDSDETPEPEQPHL